jgi:hypothetical protein
MNFCGKLPITTIDLQMKHFDLDYFLSFNKKYADFVANSQKQNTRKLAKAIFRRSSAVLGTAVIIKSKLWQ